MSGRAARWAVLAALASACALVGDSTPEQVPLGTWGGDDAGWIVDGQGVHLHVGCTRGEIPGRVAVAADGRFEVLGRHNVDAFPVDLGITHPALYTGQMFGDDRLRFEVRLLDADLTLGPAVVFRDREPRMRHCPICR